MDEDEENFFDKKSSSGFVGDDATWWKPRKNIKLYSFGCGSLTTWW